MRITPAADGPAVRHGRVSYLVYIVISLGSACYPSVNAFPAQDEQMEDTAGQSQDHAAALMTAISFQEAFFEVPPDVSVRSSSVGVSVVGLRLQTSASKFDPANVFVAFGDRGRVGKTLCIKISSRDGRYSAQGRYALEKAGASLARIGVSTKFAARLAEYASADIAIAAAVAPTCNDYKRGEFLPVIMGRDAQPTLMIQLRAGDAPVRAQLGRNDAPIGPAVLCDKVAVGATAGFSEECRLPIPRRMEEGAYLLTIGETSSTGQASVKTFTTFLAGLNKSM